MTKTTKKVISYTLTVFLTVTVCLPQAFAQSKEELQQEVATLKKQLADAQAKLQAVETEKTQEISKLQSELAEAKNRPAVTQSASNSDLLGDIRIGDFKFGGAIRANYVIGDYQSTPGPGRGDDGGNFELDTFRFNVDYAHEDWMGALEYRFYNGYNFLHTGWIGYQLDESSTVKVGVNRVPFGPGPYGVSQSWFFDQHYYVGLSDDMDLGVKYTKNIDNLTVDAAYYYSGEGNWNGASKDSARYSYDVVNETGNGYEERHQINFRGVYSLDIEGIATDLGLSAQYGLLESRGPQSDGDHYAASAHMVNKWDNWTLASQLTYYTYNVSNHTLESGAVSDDLIDMGAYDFAWPVAAEAYIPAISLAYKYETKNIDWLEYVKPYIEYSAILKEESNQNDSEMLTVGAAWKRGGWYIYTDFAYSNGNYFVSNDDFTTFGANPNDTWQYRFNINFGYYF